MKKAAGSFATRNRSNFNGTNADPEWRIFSIIEQKTAVAASRQATTAVLIDTNS